MNLRLGNPLMTNRSALAFEIATNTRLLITDLLRCTPLDCSVVRTEPWLRERSVIVDALIEIKSSRGIAAAISRKT